MRRILLVSACATAYLLLAAAPALAHAQLEESIPRSQAELESSPGEVVLIFDEAVDVSIGGIRLYDGSGSRVDVGAPEFPDGDRSRVRSSVGDLDDGSYVVTWRVSSADGHPVQGAFTFQVGDDATANIESLAARLLQDQSGDSALGIAYGVDRFVVFASLAVALGGVGFLVIVDPLARASQTARRTIVTALVVCALATLASIGLHGAYVAGLGLGDATSVSLVRDVLDLRFGRIAAVRLLLLGVLGALLVPLIAKGRVERSLATWWYVATAVVGVAIAATPGLAGHASSGRFILAAQVTDVIHVLAMCLWIGGLVLLVAVLLPQRDATGSEGPLQRFSRLALGCVAALVLTGGFQAWRQVGSIAGLRDTDYGRLLIVKVILVGIIVIVAAASRETVYRLYGPPPEPDDADDDVILEPSGLSDDSATLDGSTVVVDELVGEEVEFVDEQREIRRLRLTVTIEIVFAIAVLAVTAALVNTPPPRGLIDGPFVEDVVVTDELQWQFIVDPAIAGPNDIHLTATTPGGGPAEPLEVSLVASFPAEDIGPIEVPLRRSGTGHYLVFGFDLPIAGEWSFEITTLVSPTVEETNEVLVTLR